jgi:hypothetical protein
LFQQFLIFAEEGLRGIVGRAASSGEADEPEESQN